MNTGEGRGKLAAAPVIAFVATADPVAALRFYGDRLGLRLLEDGPFALVFDAAGTMLRVQKVATVAPVPYTVLGWAVDDIDGTVDGLVAAGVAAEHFPGMDADARGILRFADGTRVAWFRDPDGNLLSLTAAP